MAWSSILQFVRHTIAPAVAGRQRALDFLGDQNPRNTTPRPREIFRPLERVDGRVMSNVEELQFFWWDSAITMAL
jgi:hypothetical protein